MILNSASATAIHNNERKNSLEKQQPFGKYDISHVQAYTKK